jgi:hypothetical protein
MGQLPADFAITASECTTIAKAFANPSNIPLTGLTVAGTKYIVPMAEETIVFGKSGTNGVFAAATKQTILVAPFDGTDSAAGGQVRSTVEGTAAYLTSQGY